MQTASLPAKATHKERWAWYAYDIGNSAYAAVVILAIYLKVMSSAVRKARGCGAFRWALPC